MTSMEIESGLSKFTILHNTTKIDRTDPWEACCTHPNFLSFISQRWAEQKHMTNCFKVSLLKIYREKITRSVFAPKYTFLYRHQEVCACVFYIFTWGCELILSARSVSVKSPTEKHPGYCYFLFLPLNSSGRAKTYFQVPEVDRLHTIQP